MPIEIKVNDAALQHSLTALQSALHDLTPVMRALAGVLAGAAEDAFEGERDPVSGASWTPLATSTRLARQRSGYDGKMLQVTGSLASSLERRYGPDYALVGTNVVYAAIHQLGGKTRAHRIVPRFRKALNIPGVGPRKSVEHPGSVIPARPFLGVSERDVATMRAVVERHLRKALDGGA